MIFMWYEPWTNIAHTIFQGPAGKQAGMVWLRPVTDSIKEVNPSLDKFPLKFNGSLAKLGLTCMAQDSFAYWKLIFTVNQYQQSLVMGATL